MANFIVPVRGFKLRGEIMSGVIVDVKANTRRADRDLQQLKQSVSNIEKKTTAASKAFSRLGRGIAASVAAVVTGGYFKKVSDEFVNMDNRIRLVTGDTQDLTMAQERLMQMSQRTRNSFAASTEVFGRLGLAMKDSGKSVGEVLDITESIQEAVAISGVSAESASSALVQLGQGIAAGALRGQELNSVMEQTPRIAKVLADHLQIGIGGLRKVAEEGGLTAEVVFEAFKKQSGNITKEFATLTPTIGQTFLVLGQSIKVFTRNFTAGFGEKNLLVEFLTKLTGTIDDAAQDITLSTAIFVSKFNTFVSDVSLIATPLIGIMKEIGYILIGILPSPEIMLTLAREFKIAVLKVASVTITPLKALANSILSTFEKVDILGRKGITTALHDLLSIDFSFSRKTLLEYSNALTKLKEAFRFNREDSAFTNAERAIRKIKYAAKDLSRFLGFSRDTFIIFRPSDIALYNRVAYQFGEITDRVKREVELLKYPFLAAAGQFAPFFSKFFALNWVIEALFKVVELFGRGVDYSMRLAGNAFDKFFERGSKTSGILDFFNRLPDSIHNLFKEMSGESSLLDSLGLSDALHYYKDMFVDGVNQATASLSKAKGMVSDFADSIIGYFRDVWDAVVGHSWWPDTIDGVIEYAADLWNKVKRHFDNFKEGVIGTFKWIADNIGSILFSLFNIAGWFAAFTTGLVQVFYTVQAVLLGIAAVFQTVFGSMTAGTGALMVLGALFAPMVSLVKTFLFYSVRMGPALAAATMGFSLLAGMFPALIPLVSASLTATLMYIGNFSKKVIGYFFDIYDEVIGHSWWPDTMDGVVDYASDLVNRVKRPLQNFKDYVVGVFSSMRNTKLFRVSADIFSDFKSSDFMDQLLSVPGSKKGFTEIISGLTETFKSEFPDIFKTVMSALGSIAVALLFPAGKLKNLLVLAFTGAAIQSGTFIADSFVGNFDESILGKAGEAAGAFIGEAIASIVTHLPQIVGMALDFVSGFVEELAKRLPFIGGLFEAIFAIGNSVGIGGAFGLIGAFFLGKGVMPLLMQIKYVKKAVEFFTSKAMLGFVAGKSGFISKFLFGTIGATRLLSGLGIILALNGALDQIIENKLVKLALNVGLIYLMFAGKNGLGKVFSVMKGVSRNMLAFFPALASMFRGKSTAIDMFVGSTTSRVDAFARVRKEIFEFGKDLVAIGRQGFYKAEAFVMTMFLGKGRVIPLILAKFNMIKTAIMASLAGLTGSGAGIIGSLFGSGTGIAVFLSGILAKFKSFATAASAIALKAGGKGGLLFKIFGRVAAIVALFALFSKTASASDEMTTGMDGLNDSTQDIESNFDKMLSAMKRFATDNPLITTLVPALIAGFGTILFRARALSKIKLAEMQGRAANFVGPAGPNKTGSRLGMLAGGAAAAGTAFAMDDLLNAAMIASMVAPAVAKATKLIFSKLGSGVQSGLTKMVSGIAMRVGAIALGTVAALVASVPLIIAGMVAIIVAAISSIGLIGIVLFGDGETWQEKLRGAWRSVKDFFGLLDKETTRGEDRFAGMLEDPTGLADRDYGIKVNFDEQLQEISPELLSSREINRVEKALSRYNEMLAEASEEEKEFGELKGDTIENLKAFEKQVIKTLDKAAIKSRYSLAEVRENINQLYKVEPTGWFDSTTESVSRSAEGLKYWTREWLSVIEVAQNPGNEDALDRRRDLLKEMDAFEKNLPDASALTTTVQAKIDVAIEFGVYSEGISDLKLMKELSRAESMLMKAAADMKELDPDDDDYDEKLTKRIAAMKSYESNLNGILTRVNAVAKKDSDRKKLLNDFKELQSLLKDTSLSIKKEDISSIDVGDYANLNAIAEQLKNVNAEYAKVGDRAEYAGLSMRKAALEARFETFMKISVEKASLSTLDETLAHVERLGMELDTEFLINLNPVELDAANEELMNLELLMSNMSTQAQAAIEAGGSYVLPIDVALDKQTEAKITTSFDAFQTYFKRRVAIFQNDLSSGEYAMQTDAFYKMTGLDPSILRRATAEQVREYGAAFAILKGVRDKHVTKIEDRIIKAENLKRLEDNLEKIIPAAQSLDSIVSDINAMGLNLGFENIGSFDAAELINLKGLSGKLKELQKKMQLEIKTGSFSPVVLKNLQTQIKQLMVKAKEAFDKGIKLSATDLSKLMSDAGFSVEPWRIIQIPAGMLKTYEGIAKQVKAVKADLESADFVGSIEDKRKELQNYIELVASLKTEYSSLSEKVSAIGDAFPELNANAFSFNQLSAQAGNAISKAAFEVLEARRTIEQQAGIITKDSIAAAKTAEIKRLQALSDARKEFEDTATFGTQVETILKAFKDIGVTRDEVERLPVATRKALFGLANQFKSSAADITMMSGSIGALGDTTKQAVKELAAGGKALLAPTRGFVKQGVTALDKFGINVDEASYRLVDDTKHALFMQVAKALDKLESQIDDPQLTDATRKAAQLAYDDLKTSLNQGIESHINEVKNVEAIEAGKAFASKQMDSISSGLKQILKGDTSTTIWDVMVEWAHNMVDTFVDGMMSSLTKGVGIDEMFADLGKDMFSFGAGAAEPLEGADATKSALDTATLAIQKNTADANILLGKLVAKPTQIAGATSPVGTDVASSIGGVDTGNEVAKDIAAANLAGNKPVIEAGKSGTDKVAKTTETSVGGLSAVNMVGFAGIATALYGLGSGSGDQGLQLAQMALSAYSMTLATGGPVSGPGTGTSDSIPTMLSNGEFVINAKATKSNRELLDYINEGGSMSDVINTNVLHFATGGYVAAAPDAPRNVGKIISKSMPKSSSANESVFNINITGDVSRQTRSEVQKMLPNIAAGVNAHNNEIGYRR